MKAIPQDLYRAARVDGAGAWAISHRITLPLLAPTISIVLVFRSLDTFRVFGAVYVLTGGPGNNTETLSIYAYKTLFQTLQFGYGGRVGLRDAQPHAGDDRWTPVSSSTTDPGKRGERSASPA